MTEGENSVIKIQGRQEKVPKHYTNSTKYRKSPKCPLYPKNPLSLGTFLGIKREYILWYMASVSKGNQLQDFWDHSQPILKKIKT